MVIYGILYLLYRHIFICFVDCVILVAYTFEMVIKLFNKIQDLQQPKFVSIKIKLNGQWKHIILVRYYIIVLKR